jgi:hypothetical protein
MLSESTFAARVVKIVSAVACSSSPGMCSRA